MTLVLHARNSLIRLLTLGITFEPWPGARERKGHVGHYGIKVCLHWRFRRPCGQG